MQSFQTTIMKKYSNMILLWEVELRDVEIMLDLVDLNIALLELKTDASKDANFVSVVVKFDKWDRTNRLSSYQVVFIRSRCF